MAMAKTREELIELERQLIQRGAMDFGALSDAFEIARTTEDHEHVFEIRKHARQHIGKVGSSAVEFYHRTLIYAGTYDFDSFMQALEFNRPAKEQFWIPRRAKLLPVCKALQDMKDDKLDELFLSCPPRIGKSTLIMMFVLWIMGIDDERSNLYSSYTDSVCKVFYNGILEVLTDSKTYCYGDIFQSKIASTDAKDLLLNLGRKKKYASLTSRSLYGTLNGACDCNGIIIGDDLVSGIEEAMSKDRLKAVWSKVDNNFIPRAKENAKMLWIGTRWSIIDPQGVRIDLLENDEKFKNRRWKILNTPAVNDDDESNFEYMYGVGFSTDYYQQRRASFERNSDIASWAAQYMGQPIERDGSCFSPEDLRFYNGVLPDVQPDRVFMVIDPSWGGGDYTAGLVVKQYGNDLFIPSVIYSNADKTVTQPMICAAVEKYGVTAMKIEGTKTTASYGEDIDKRLREKNIRINMTINTSHFTGMGKRDRIIARSSDIRERMIFLAEGKRKKEYSQFMQNLYGFTFTGKAVKHDDAPDVCAMCIDYVTNGTLAKAEVVKRPW